jgi:hypothetical protein
VRWTIQTAWSAFESVCGDALSATGLGNRFKERFNVAVNAKGLPAVDWGKGIWQQVFSVYETRKKFTHVVPSVSSAALLTPLQAAENSIVVLRKGILAVADLVSAPHPPWAADDDDKGWAGREAGSGASVFVVRAGTQEDDPQNVRITYEVGGREHLSEISPPETPHGPLLDRLVAALNIPVGFVRAYRGEVLLEERPTKMRT